MRLSTIARGLRDCHEVAGCSAPGRVPQAAIICQCESARIASAPKDVDCSGEPRRLAGPRHGAALGSQVDDKLPAWEDVRGKAKWSGILLGNGASRAVWDEFKYPSLYEMAASGSISNPLTTSEQKIFTSLQTTNFESVLSELQSAIRVCSVLDMETEDLEFCYKVVKDALIEAVRLVHISRDKVPKETLQQISTELRRYQTVYVTNYDLLVYWSIMSKDASRFCDFFWADGGCAFDLSNTEVWESKTRLLYLHGALHLYRTRDGRVRKMLGRPGNGILDRLSSEIDKGNIPLFVSEGTAEDKIGSIRRSDYLTFAYKSFLQHRRPLVVFGHSLSPSDKHLVDAIKMWGSQKLAISMMPDTSDGIISRKHGIHSMLPAARITFFDARTHPLGAASLRVEP